MLVDLFCAHRNERSRPDVKGETHDFDSVATERVEHRFREMQSRRWGGDRTERPGVDGLIGDTVVFTRRPPNVRRKRYLADVFEQCGDRARAIETHAPQTLLISVVKPGGDDSASKPCRAPAP